MKKGNEIKLDTIDGRLTHHAYVLEGGSDAGEALCDVLEKECGVVMQGNPDVWRESFDVFGVDESRMLKEMQSRRGVQGKKIFIVQTTTITREAQNALLKVFEEPTEGTHLFLIVPKLALLLPTLRSRLVVVSVSDANVAIKTDEKEAHAFLSASLPERLTHVKEIIDSKDKARATALLDGIEALLYTTHDMKTLSAQEMTALQTLQQYRQYLHDRSPSLKLLLEHIALTIPKL